MSFKNLHSFWLHINFEFLLNSEAERLNLLDLLIAIKPLINKDKKIGKEKEKERRIIGFYMRRFFISTSVLTLFAKICSTVYTLTLNFFIFF